MALKYLVALAACGLALAFAPTARAETRSQNAELVAIVDAQFTVIEADAHVSFPSYVTRYEILDDDSLLLTFGANRLYRVKLHSDCARDLRNNFGIGIAPDGSGLFDSFGHIALRDRSCAVDTIDRVERRAGPDA